MCAALLALGGAAGCAAKSSRHGATWLSESEAAHPAPSSPKASASPTPSPTPKPPPTLPRGGRRIFPNYRVIAYYGGPGGPGLGVLGNGTPDQAAAAVEQQAQQYAFAGRPVQPALEFITTVALASPGLDGIYSSRGDPAIVQQYLNAARAHKELLVLDFQPGQSDFLSQIRRFQKFLVQPDVGVALDPEWRMQPGQIPGKVLGSAAAAEINQVSAYVAGLVAKYRLPQKLFVIHQFNLAMLPDRQAIVARRGLATVFHADGHGPPGVKSDVYHDLAFPGPPFYRGFKLFFQRDTPMMTPQQVMALNPAPDLVTYQ